MSCHLIKIILGVIILCLSGGCDIVSGPPSGQVTLKERIADFKKIPQTKALKNTQILWNDYGVPYIISKNDNDAAFALGLVQAHLRLGQMEMGKRIAQGRLSESLGFYFNDIDHTIRIVNFYQSAHQTLKQMPATTKNWLKAYVDGINHYKKFNPRPHYDFQMFQFDNEPWTPQDSIALIKLGGTDLHWIAISKILPYAKGGHERKILSLEKQFFDQTFIANNNQYSSKNNFISVKKENTNRRDFNHILSLSNKSGSNAYVIASDKSTTNAPILAGDPHLGIFLPNFWTIAGIHSPSYKMVGMMVAGTPVFSFGRTHHLAWSGTNLRALQSDFIDISLQTPQPIFDEKTIIIKNRWWWWDTKRVVRTAKEGVIISDSNLFPEINNRVVALKWIGHTNSDEITAMLKASKAKNADGFIEALKTFALPAQNMVFADHHGNIGNILASFVPNRENKFPDKLFTTSMDVSKNYKKIYNATTLPKQLNPKNGFIVSANNLIYHDDAKDKPLISWYTTSDERAIRLTHIFNEHKKFSVADFKSLQKDVFSISSFALKNVLLSHLQSFSPSDLKEYEAVISSLSEWDGHYYSDSRGALLIEGFLDGIIRPLSAYEKNPIFFETYEQDTRFVKYITKLLKSLTLQQAKPIILLGLNRARELGETHQSWGDIHTMKIGHIASNIPLVGKSYQIHEFPAGGNRETLMKTSSDRTPHPHGIKYGSQARFIADMSNINHNYFALLGGQDGYFSSDNFSDQIWLWRMGNYIEIPLDSQSISKKFPYGTYFAQEITNTKLHKDNIYD